MLKWFLIVLLGVCESCSHITPSSPNAQSKRSKSMVHPLNIPAPLSDFAALEKDKGDRDMVEALADIKFEGLEDRFWQSYLLGLGWFKEKQFGKGMEYLQKPIHWLSGKDVKEGQGTLFRIASVCLKKMGWYHRTQKNYHKALERHLLSYVYADYHGSPEEKFDRALSLDMDSFYLGQSHLSLHWLAVAIDHGKQIKEPKFRSKALGTAFNNLSATYSSMNLYELAERQGTKSLEFWQQYESLGGEITENRVIWAYYNLAEMHLHWAQFVVESKKPLGLIKARGQEYLKLGSQLAQSKKVGSQELRLRFKELEKKWGTI